MLITAASVQDRDAAKPLLWNLRRAFPSIKLAWADGGYAGNCHVGQDPPALDAADRQAPR